MPNTETTKKQKHVMRFITEAKEFRRVIDPTTQQQVKDPPIVTKFDYALDRTMSIVITAVDETKCEKKWRDNCNDAKIDFASTDEKGNMLRNKDGGRVYTPANEKKMNRSLSDLDDVLAETPITFTPHLTTGTIPNLSWKLIEAFRGFVIPEDYTLPEPTE